MSILTVNLAFSTLIFFIAAKLYVWPRLHHASREVLISVLLLHSFRHFGLMFLASGATYPGMPSQFAVPAAAGDLIAALLAVAAIPAVASQGRFAKPLVWLFNIEGSMDLIAAIALATMFDAAPYMGPSYWIPAFWVPALLVSHWTTFVVLVRHWPRGSHTPGSAALLA